MSARSRSSTARTTTDWSMSPSSADDRSPPDGRAGDHRLRSRRCRPVPSSSLEVDPALAARWHKFGANGQTTFPAAARAQCRGGARRLLPDAAAVPGRAAARRRRRPRRRPGVAARLRARAGDRRVAARRATAYSTVDLHVQFVDSLVDEDAVAEGWIVRRGRRTVFGESEARAANTGTADRQGDLHVHRADRPDDDAVRARVEGIARRRSACRSPPERVGPRRRRGRRRRLGGSAFPSCSSSTATGIAHKTERGLVRLGLADADAVARGRRLAARRGAARRRRRRAARRADGARHGAS